jgi:hypothetical protein
VGVGASRLPTRIALLDPFFTPEPKIYLQLRTIQSLVYEGVRALSQEHNVIFEQYQTSVIGNPAVKLGSMTAFFEVDPPHIPWYRLRARHIAAK